MIAAEAIAESNTAEATPKVRRGATPCMHYIYIYMESQRHTFSCDAADQTPKESTACKILTFLWSEPTRPAWKHLQHETKVAES
jgi:hypothetical protein